MTGRRLILWDIDGTLVWWGPIGRGVFDRAVHEVVGRDPAGHGVSMGGKTDPQIALEIPAWLYWRHLLLRSEDSISK